ncbi:calcium-binding protein [Streptomyces sp. NPDC058286]|uniref:calcium-binding protein n=1 Tax=Streptomyces sp. NPDC058286 TaxID=3346422 RepID=UPI0036EF9C68
MGAAFVLLCPGAALAAPGDLDPSFGTGGKVTTDFGGFDGAQAMAVQADGKIIAAGDTVPSGSTFHFALARYNTDGSLDTSFGTGGKVTTDFDTGGASSVAIQADGKIVAAGNAGAVGSSSDFALARYNTDGSLDASFGTGGKVTTDFGGADGANGVALQADGKIIAAGLAVGDFGLARYNTDGSLDTGFGAGGKVTTGFDSGGAADDVALQADGKIVAAGSVGSPDGDFAVVRYNTDGSLDTGFGTGGKVTTDLGSRAEARGVAIQADGKIVAAGSVGTDGDFAVVRYNTDGSLDTGFGTGGKVTTNLGDHDIAQDVAVQANGQIVVAGQTGGGGTAVNFALARYNTDGSLDTGFGTGGKVITDFGGFDGATAVALQADGKIIAAGVNAIPGDEASNDFALVRYEGGGTADVSVTKTGPDTVSLGDQASYTVTVTNTSTTQSATTVTLADSLSGPGQLLSATPSQGTCTTTATSANCALGTLAPGASATVTVTAEPTATGTLSDTATVSAAESDPLPGNNTSTANTTVDNAHGCTITGTSAADNLVGTNRNDVICGLGGNDTINAGNGNDTIYGGSGNDVVDGGNSDDTVNGGPGNDTLNGGNGSDTLNGDQGNDTLSGDNGTDTVNGGPGNDTINGGNGPDTCTTDPGDTVTNCP